MNRKRIKLYNSLIEGAQQIITQKNDFVILDSETTGLGRNDVVIQIAIIDLEGNLLFESLIKPSKRKRMSSDATNVHGINMKMLENEPTFKELFPRFIEVINKKEVLIYNSEFDTRLIKQTCEQDGIIYKGFSSFCVMKAYSMFKGEWSDYYKDYKFQKLPYVDHTAHGDCLATLKVLNEMANNELIPLPKLWWEFWK